jgi:hypothetical protein
MTARKPFSEPYGFDQVSLRLVETKLISISISWIPVNAQRLKYQAFLSSEQELDFREEISVEGQYMGRKY